MGVTYTGDRTLTNDPVAAPEAGRQPAATVPVDTDPPNASTFVAGYKAAMDWVDWLRRPIAKVADWANPLKRYQSALGHTRFRVDHMGMPGGWYQELIADWVDVTPMINTGTPTQNPIARGWRAAGSSAALVTAEDRGLLDPSNAYALCRGMYLQIGGSAINDWVHVYAREEAFTFGPPMQGAMEGMFLIDTTTPTDRNYAVGFIGNVGAGSILDGTHYARILLENLGTGTGTLKCQTHNGTTQTSVDTAIAIATYRRRIAFRIEWHGADVADDATSRVLFFVDGALVANITTTLPALGAIPFAGFKEIVGGGAGPMEIGPLRVVNSYLAIDAK